MKTCFRYFAIIFVITYIHQPLFFMFRNLIPGLFKKVFFPEGHEKLSGKVVCRQAFRIQFLMEFVGIVEVLKYSVVLANNYMLTMLGHVYCCLVFCFVLGRPHCLMRSSVYLVFRACEIFSQTTRLLQSNWPPGLRAKKPLFIVIFWMKYFSHILVCFFGFFLVVVVFLTLSIDRVVTIFIYSTCRLMAFFTYLLHTNFQSSHYNFSHNIFNISNLSMYHLNSFLLSNTFEIAYIIWNLWHKNPQQL